MLKSDEVGLRGLTDLRPRPVRRDHAEALGIPTSIPSAEKLCLGARATAERDWTGVKAGRALRNAIEGGDKVSANGAVEACDEESVALVTDRDRKL